MKQKNHNSHAAVRSSLDARQATIGNILYIWGITGEDGRTYYIYTT